VIRSPKLLTQIGCAPCAAQIIPTFLFQMLAAMQMASRQTIDWPFCSIRWERV